jgi:hypothetical protein
MQLSVFKRKKKVYRNDKSSRNVRNFHIYKNSPTGLMINS